MKVWPATQSGIDVVPLNSDGSLSVEDEAGAAGGYAQGRGVPG